MTYPIRIIKMYEIVYLGLIKHHLLAVELITNLTIIVLFQCPVKLVQLYTTNTID